MPSRNDNPDMDAFAETPSAGRGLTTEDLKAAIDIALAHSRAVSLEDILQSWEEKNPLKAQKRVYEFSITGPLNTHRNGLVDMPEEEHLDMFRRSATTRGEYDLLAEPMSRQGEAVKRAGSINHAYILDIKLLSAKNSYPIPLKLHMTGLRGRHYSTVSGKASRALYGLNAETHNESYSAAKAPVIHKIPMMHENIADAFALDNVSVETLDSEVTKLKTHPGWLIVAGGLASHTCRILADSNNIEPLRQIDFDPEETWVQDLQHVGKVTVIPESAFLMCRNALARVKAEKERSVPSTDLTHFGAEFVVASKRPNITMQNIEQHENFINKTPAEVKALLDDGLRECRVSVEMRFVLKDALLDGALTPKPEQQ